jgi:hypothetical protein
MSELTSAQRSAAEFALNRKLFLFGPAGTGKSTIGLERLNFLLKQGVPGGQILILTPQRSLQDPYLEIIQSPQRAAGSEVTPATIAGLARRMCDLFWPLAAESAGFAFPDQPPIFLTLETAQYYMAYLVRPLLDQGYFESVNMDRNRLYSQILDNLNKSAMVGFAHTEIGARLDSAYFGDPAQRRIYTDAGDCAYRFRDYCLKHNLLDFSLQLEVFLNHLWPQPQVRDFLTRSYRHLIYDNLEEDGPRAHDLLRDWLPAFDSALLIYDEGAGYRRFLGADTETARALSDLCNQSLALDESFVMSPSIARMENSLKLSIQSSSLPRERIEADGVLNVLTSRFYPQLLDSIVDEVASLIFDGNLPASEIVILAPYLSDALRFSLTDRLKARGIPWRSHRPSRSLREEPACRALITLAALAHPYWNIRPPKFDLVYALMQALEGLDLVRAQLLTEIVYRQRDFTLAPFDGIQTEAQERITFLFGTRYAVLREWLLNYRESMPLPLDHFIRKLFGEVLSQPGFGYHSLNNFDAVRVTASLVESIRKFRLTMEPSFVQMDRPDFDFGKEYLSMLGEGVIAATYLEAWRPESEDAVLVAPAYTFLMMNKPVTVQFWLDIGSSGWHERLAQPLTQPYVLSRSWQPGRLWMDSDEVQANQETLARLVSGLLHRCKERVYIGLSELGESGFEQRGELLRAFQKILVEPHARE